MNLKTSALILVITSLNACKSDAARQEEHQQDSLEQVDEKTLDNIRHNEDSLMKAKEKELLEKYGN